jgi:uncharacterized LabA/DUF88 family protein
VKITVPTDDRLKIAVFIDYDNIEIGVKTTLGTRFDIGAILEAIKERGEVVTKVAYGDWTRAGDDSRALSQHAVRMVQRTLTPGGDKNGADINLALDALEMALTHEHISAYVIVGGDSDFITLVEKLKQYDKQVFVVGGRAFTSVILQKNCHEFIAYENLMSPQGGGRRAPERERPTGKSVLSQAFPLVRRAIKVLSDREVTPQLGLLKSTLLQLDSTFSERDYGASSFRDFAEKLAQAGLVVLKQTGRSLMVELKEGESGAGSAASEDKAPEPAVAGGPDEEVRVHAETPPVPVAAQAEGVRAVQRMFDAAGAPLRWPMYVRNVKHFLRSMDPTFDERRFGFGGILDLLRACQRESILRLERDRRGVLRVHPGSTILRPSLEEPVPAEPVEVGDVENAAEPVEVTAQPASRLAEESAELLPVAETETIASVPLEVVEAELVPPAAVPEPKPRRRRAASGPRKAVAAPRAKVPRPRSRKAQS